MAGCFHVIKGLREITDGAVRDLQIPHFLYNECPSYTQSFQI